MKMMLGSLSLLLFVVVRGQLHYSLQGSKLVGSGAIGNPNGGDEGNSVALNGDGTVLVVGGSGEYFFLFDSLSCVFILRQCL